MGTGSFYDKLIHSDWLGRSESDYTYAKKGHSVGWEDTLTAGTAFSSFLMRVDGRYDFMSNQKKIRLAKEACTNIMNRMLTGSGKKSKITFSDEFKNYAQGSMICVTLEPLKQDNEIKFPTYNHALDPILGYCAHEIAHILYTGDEYGNYLKKFAGKELKLKATIMNVLEDERIENLIAQNFRGYTHYVGKAKDYCFGKKFQLELSKGFHSLDKKSEPVNKLMEVFIHLLRYPKALREEMVNEFESEVTQIQEILTPYPVDLVELSEASHKVYEVFLKLFKENNAPKPPKKSDQPNDKQEQKNEPNEPKNEPSEEPNQEEPDQEEQQEKAKAEDGGGNVDSDKGDGGEEQETEDDGEEREESDGSGGDTDDEEYDESDDSEKTDGTGPGDGEEAEDESDEVDSGGGSGDGGEDGENSEPEITEEEFMEKLAEALEEMLEKLAGSEAFTGDMEEVIKTVFNGDYSAGQQLRSITDFDNSDIAIRHSDTGKFQCLAGLNSSELEVVFLDAKNSTSTRNYYKESLAEVRVYASSLRAEIMKLNRNTQVVSTGLYEGDFDDGLLVDAIIGTKNVYSETFQMTNPGAIVVLCVDESGSMVTNWEKAQQVAVMFERALVGANNIDFYCYGHTTTSDPITKSMDSTAINCYFEGRKSGDKNNLGKIFHHNTNRDGHAIVEIVSRIRATTTGNLPIVMFMLSDGQPSASVPEGYDRESYTKKCVDTVEKTMNTSVIHIAIEEGIDSASMFNHHVEFTDFRTLTRDIGKLLKKVIVDKQAPITL